MGTSLGNVIATQYNLTSGLFDPASIKDSNGNLLLRQFLFGTTALSGSTIFDDSSNKGSARTVQLGRSYLSDGINDVVITTLNFNDFCQNTFSLEFWLDPADGQPAADQVFLGGQDNAAFGSQGTGANNGIIIVLLTTGKLTVGYKAGGNVGLATTNAALFTNGAQTAPRKFRATVTAGIGITIDEYISNAWVGVVLDVAADGSFATNNVVMSSFSYSAFFYFMARNNNGVAGSFFTGKLFGLQIKNSSDTNLAFYKCDEQDGTISYDSSGNARHGTITNATLGTFHSTQSIYSWQNEVGYSKPATVFIPRNEAIPAQDVTGAALTFIGRVPYNALLKQSNCISLNGTSQYCSIPHNASLNVVNNLSVTIRAKNTNALISADQILASKYGTTTNKRQWLFRITSDEKLTLTISNDGVITGTLASNAAIDINNAKTYGFTFPNTINSGKLYVNGVEVAATVTGGIITSIFNGDEALLLGAVNPSVPGSHWNGQLYDMRIYGGTVLTAAEMLAIHNNTDTTTGATLIAHYPLAANAGSVVYDASGNALDGTTINSPTVGKQDNYHHNISKGFSRYDHASLADILVPYANGIPRVITAPGGYTKISDNPSGLYHNGAETLIDFTNGVASPQAVVNAWETAWAFNTIRVNPEFRRTLTLAGLAYRMDRALAYSTAISGVNLTKVQNYTLTRAL